MPEKKLISTVDPSGNINITGIITDTPAKGLNKPIPVVAIAYKSLDESQKAVVDAFQFLTKSLIPEEKKK